MKIDEVIQQPGQNERFLKQDIMKSLHVAVPGEVVSYNPDNRTAVIQPVIREWKSKENPPLLVDVPVFFAGNYTFTPQKGDGCLVVFADSCIDSWFQSGGVSTPIVSRSHSMSDGFAFVGFRQTGGTPMPSGSYKNLQDPVSDPTAAGTGIEFIDSISQNEQGVISPHKKTVSTMGGATSGGNGTAGLVPAPSSLDIAKFLRGDGQWANQSYPVVTKLADGLCPQLPNENLTTKYLRQDGTWYTPPDTTYGVVSKTDPGLCPQLPNETATTKYLRQDGSWYTPPDTTYGVVSKTDPGLCPQLPNETTTTKFLRQDGGWYEPPTYSLPLAADGTRGGVQIGYTQNNQNYPVQLSNEKMYVNVPWTDSSGNDKLPLAGGVMTGTITFETVTAIKYKATQSTKTMVKFVENTADTGGHGILIGGGGITVVGGGEAATTMADTYSPGAEKLVLCNDNQIDFYVNCNNGVASAVHTYLDSSGVYHGNVSGKATSADQLTLNEIASGTNLNNLTTPGFYGCSTGAIAESLSNSPTTANFSMIVMIVGGARVMQIIFGGSNIWTRKQSSTGFSSWKGFA